MMHYYIVEDTYFKKLSSVTLICFLRQKFSDMCSTSGAYSYLKSRTKNQRFTDQFI